MIIIIKCDERDKVRHRYKGGEREREREVLTLIYIT